MGLRLLCSPDRRRDRPRRDRRDATTMLGTSSATAVRSTASEFVLSIAHRKRRPVGGQRVHGQHAGGPDRYRYRVLRSDESTTPAATRESAPVITLTPLLDYATTCGRCRVPRPFTGRSEMRMGWVSVCSTRAHVEQVVDAVARFFDGRVDIRADQGDLDLRVAGLQNQPTNWSPVGT